MRSAPLAVTAVKPACDYGLYLLVYRELHFDLG